MPAQSLTPAEAELSLLNDIAAMLRLTAKLSEDATLAQAAGAMLERLERNAPLKSR